MPEIGVVADDLSGAADCGIAFAEVGLRSVVALDHLAACGDADAVIVDTDTREAGPDAARNRVRAVGAELAALDLRVIYKKVDSTLRGELAVEVAALLDACHRDVAVVAPALPAMGRVIRDGRLLVRGVPLEQTHLWRIAGRPALGELATMLSATGSASAHAGLDTVRVPGALRSELRRCRAAGIRALGCDAEREEDLERIALETLDSGLRVLWVGSAGLAKALPRPLGLPAHRPCPPPRATGPVVTVVGSAARAAREQLRALLAADGVADVGVDPRPLLAGPGSAGLDDAAVRVADAVREGRDALLYLQDCEVAGTAAERRRAVAALGRLVAPVGAALGGLVLTGGETARAVLAALGVTALELQGELVPGIAFAGTIPDGLPVITKAGGFGSPDALRRCRDVLKGATT